jgi:hypothetical protein
MGSPAYNQRWYKSRACKCLWHEGQVEHNSTLKSILAGFCSVSRVLRTGGVTCTLVASSQHDNVSSAMYKFLGVNNLLLVLFIILYFPNVDMVPLICIGHRHVMLRLLKRLALLVRNATVSEPGLS